MRRRPKTAELEEGSRKRFGSEFHIDEPATANARPYVVHRCTTLNGILLNVLNIQRSVPIDGCIVWNAHDAVFGSKRSTICATV